MEFPKVHMGARVKKAVRAKQLTYRSVNDKLQFSAKNGNDMYKREEIKPALLRRLSLLLGEDFFIYYLSAENQQLLAKARQQQAEAAAPAKIPAQPADQTLAEMELNMLRSENAYLKEINQLLKQMMAAK